MSAEIQTLVALGIVALAGALLARHYFRKRAQPGCGSGGDCGAVSPDVKKLQARIKR